MKLRELLEYPEIHIQCHDNPDPDTIAAGYALYRYFLKEGKKVKLFYSGERTITKPNIIMFIEDLKIPLEYIRRVEEVEGLLITIDCQYGAGNVTYIKAKHVAVIDHHIQERPILEKQEIRSELASSSTLVWDMLCNEHFDVNDDIEISTALYYGLFTDSGGFMEVSHALDKDMRDSLKYDERLIRKLKHSIITLKELEIAGMALIRSSYNEANRCVMVKAQECDPNILGLISDFALQVDCVNVVIVYNETAQGIKYSVRSCVKEIMANELASFLSKGIGNGGGHRDKAAGFIGRNQYNEYYRHLNADEYFLRQLTDYYQSYEIIYGSHIHFLDDSMVAYKKLPSIMGYIKLDKIVPDHMPFIIRTQKEDQEYIMSELSILVVEGSGQVTVINEEDFRKYYEQLDEQFESHLNYFPRVIMKSTGELIHLKKQTKKCLAIDEKRVWARRLNKAVKLFVHDRDEQYKIGQVGDYLVVEEGANREVHIVQKEFFDKQYIQQ